MIPQIPATSYKDGTSTSFEKVITNLSHDRRENLAQPHPATSDRVAWISLRNLMPDISPLEAAAIMTATADSRKAKRLALGKYGRGRPSDRVVFQYSLSWHPSENPTREEMEQAADETLDALGASNRQAVIFCHTHRQNSIIQIVVNRVDDQTGLMLRLYNSMVTLSQWARGWEIRHGTIFTPNRKIAKAEQGLQTENDVTPYQGRQANPLRAVVHFTDQPD